MHKQRRNLLIVSYYWPPAAGAAINRVLNFIEHMPALGWSVHVLTVKSGDYAQTDENYNVPDNIIVHKTSQISFLKLIRLFNSKNPLLSNRGFDNKNLSVGNKVLKFIKYNLIPDTKIGWIPFALSEGTRMIKKYNIDVILSTSPPHTNQFVSSMLSHHSKVPLIQDYRDPWTNIFWLRNHKLRLGVIHKLDQKIERWTIDKASYVTTVSNDMATYLDIKGKHKTIYHGYKNKPTIHSNDVTSQSVNGSKIKMVYAGTLSSSQDVSPLLMTLNKMKEKRPWIYKIIQINIIGKINAEVKSIIANTVHYHLFNYEGFLPRELVSQKIQESDICLVFGVKSVRFGLIASKLYDYMQFRKPIIGFDLEQEARTILTDSGLGVAYPESNVESIIDFIEDPNMNINESLIESLSIDNQMKKMSDLSHTLCE